jgi:CBS domain-containing protein
MQIEEVMTKDVGYCRVDDPLNVAAQIMWDRDCGCVPVLDDARRPVGMLTDRDLCMAAYTRGAPLAQIRADAVMSKQVHVCHPGDAIDVARKDLAEHQVRRLPVVGADGRLVGILSLSDLARAMLTIRGAKPNGSGADAIETTLIAISRPRPDRSGAPIY